MPISIATYRMPCCTYDVSRRIFSDGSVAPDMISMALSRMAGVTSRRSVVRFSYHRPISAQELELSPLGVLGENETVNCPAIDLQLGIIGSDRIGSLSTSSHVHRFSPVGCGLMAAW